jgi:DNA-directed RNA polymerase specialized sigma subunit
MARTLAEVTAAFDARRARQLTRAQQAMVEANRPLAWHEAWRFWARHEGFGFELADVRSEALLGLIYAVQRYDPARGRIIATGSNFETAILRTRSGEV